jgi:hypothetical protein
MQEFIRMASSVLGTTEDVARQATSTVLGLIAQVAPAADVQELLSRLPGAGDLLRAFAPAPAPPPSGAASVMGGVSDLVSNTATALQGALGAGSALLGLVGQIGLDPQKGAQFLSLFAGFAREHAGGELVDRVLSYLPGGRSLFS